MKLVLNQYIFLWPQGGLFNENEEEQELVFRFAIDRINADKTILPKTTLVAQIEKIGKEDSFHADKKGDNDSEKVI